jgi:hypothetical protein
MMTPFQKELCDPKHPKVVVMMPHMKPHYQVGVPFGSTNNGRTYRTPTGRIIIFATPDQPIPNGPFHLILEGWGHQPSADETRRNNEWRLAAAG